MIIICFIAAADVKLSVQTRGQFQHDSITWYGILTGSITKKSFFKFFIAFVVTDKFPINVRMYSYYIRVFSSLLESASISIPK